MVQDIGNTVRTLKPKVLYGISPQGKQENSMTVYADAQIMVATKVGRLSCSSDILADSHATADFFYCS